MKRTLKIKKDIEEENIYDQFLKLNVIQEIEQGEISTFDACLRYGIKDRSIINSWIKEKKSLGYKIKPKRNSTEIKKSLEQKIIKMELKLQFIELEDKILKGKLDLKKKAV